MNLILFVCGKTGFQTLKAVIGDGVHRVAFIYTDRHSSDIISFSMKNMIPFSEARPKIDDIINLKFDLGLSVNYKFVLKREIYDYPANGTYNLHGSLLPKYRGRCPNVWSVIMGEKETGVTIHKIDDGVDTGGIAIQKKIPITDQDTGSSILEKSIDIYPVVTKEFLYKFMKNEIRLEKQDHHKAMYFGKRSPEDGMINWSSDSCRIHDWIRAQTKSYYPGAFTFLNNKKITIWKSTKDKRLLKNKIAGEIVKIIDKKSKNSLPIIKVTCGEGFIDLIEYEPEIKVKVGQVFQNGK